MRVLISWRNTVIEVTGLRLLARSCLTHGVFMTCMGMSGNGVWIGLIMVTAHRWRLIRLARLKKEIGVTRHECLEAGRIIVMQGNAEAGIGEIMVVIELVTLEVISGFVLR